ncbi:MAG: flagellar protein FlgN [Gammaproteobacteria bacterium]|nr:flagellar protein FlgN [Gammaproteobacteria bacterium]
MDVTEIAPEIEQLVSQELVCLSKLDELLSKEHLAIKNSNQESLQQHLLLKEPYITHLQQLEQQRNHVMICHGLAPTVEAFTDLLLAINSPELDARWDLVKQQLEEVKLHNEVNGRLINMRRNTNENILKILLGNRHVSNNTYSATGRKDTSVRTGLSFAV